MDYADEALSRLLAAWDGAAALVETYGPEAVAALVRGVQIQGIVSLSIAAGFGLALLIVCALAVRSVVKAVARATNDPDRSLFEFPVIPIASGVAVMTFIFGSLAFADGVSRHVLPAIDPIAYIAREALLP